MSKIEVNTVAPQCGATLTLGESGDTVQLGTGASQSGFGRTGTVDWQTGSIKTGTFTAANGEGYFCNTTSGGFTVNLPAGSAGNIVSLQDYNNTFDSNALTVAPNGSEKINGGAGSISLGTEGEGITLVYIDSTVGWRSIQDNDFASAGSNFIAATGGTITTSGDYKIHTFTSPGTFQVTATAPGPSGNPNIADYLVVAGGGGGGIAGGGGGGARFFATTPLNPQSGPAAPRNGYGSPSPSGTQITFTATSYPITVGGGGSPGGVTPSLAHGTRGSNSIFSTITSTGGGGGGAYTTGGAPIPSYEGPGGSGGGAYNAPASPATNPNPGNPALGTGNTPPVSPSQGSNGGESSPQNRNSVGMGGGGGMMAVGGNGTYGPCGGEGNGGPGGAGGGLTGFGASNGVCSSCVQYFAGGGGGGAQKSPGPSSTTKAGGLGGGGTGVTGPGVNGTAGTTNTGGGGGGGAQNAPSTGGAGGSGIVVIRYKFQ